MGYHFFYPHRFSPLTRISEVILYSRTLGPLLPSTNSLVWFATRTAFLGPLVADPPVGFRQWKLAQRPDSHMSYLIMHTLRILPRVLSSGKLEL